ncbi:MAG: GTP cyclohydrolase I FolE2 [Deltaproteobacteria bacterium]|nr:MAG: GTP cyclohydrolase I FolE2 [Deltaproteobacteria bacterium]
MNHRPDREQLPDHAAEHDERGLPIDAVGIRDLRWPVVVMDRDRRRQSTVATLSLSVRLPATQKGTHMSRLVECLEANGGELSLRTLPDLLASMQRRLEAQSVQLRADFPYFVRKLAPVSGVPSWLDSQCSFQAERHGDTVSFALHVEVPVTSLCPCSKAISDYGAHNQRSLVRAKVISSQMVWIEDVIEAIESVASAPLFALLKREDEKYVTELAYDNPRFVEDLVRESILALRGLPGVTSVEVEADNAESIHNHSAFARVRWPTTSTIDPAQIGAEQTVEPLSFADWLRARRGELRLSQAELGQQLGVSKSWISRVESGERQLSCEALVRLAQVLGQDPQIVQLRAGVVPDDLMSRIATDPAGFRRWAARGDA